MKLIVLDLDDTLYLERDYVRSGFDAVGAFVAEKFGVAGASTWLWQQFEAGIRGDTFNRLMHHHDLPSADVNKLINVYRTHAPRIKLEDDARDYLEYWHGRVPLALVTDGYFPGQQKKVEALGIRHFFDELVFTDERGPDWPKPNATAFTYLQDYFGARPPECIYIGDNPNKDFDGPRELGWKWSRIRRPGSLHYTVPTPPGGATHKQLAEPGTHTERVREHTRLVRGEITR